MDQITYRIEFFTYQGIPATKKPWNVTGKSIGEIMDFASDTLATIPNAHFCDGYLVKDGEVLIRHKFTISK